MGEMIDRIDMLCRRKGIKNLFQLSKAAGILYSTLDNIYKAGGESGIKLPTLKKLANFLDVTMEYLVCGKSGKKLGETLSEQAVNIAIKYDSLDRYGQTLLNMVADRETERLHYIDV